MLDVGTGSGYQAAVLAELAAEVRDDRARARARRAARERRSRRPGYDAVDVRVGDGTLGVADRRPTTGSPSRRRPPRRRPRSYEQLAPDGRLVVPVGGRRGQRLQVVVGRPTGAQVTRSVACRFVPLVGE